MKIAMTGGHHSSALPIIKELQKSDVEIIWFGRKYAFDNDKNPTLEYLDISDLNLKFIDIHTGRLYKNINLKNLFKIAYGIMQAFYYLVKYRPNKIMSFGGYLAVPVVVSAWILQIKIFTHEQTLVVGYANKLISKFASKIFISWPDSSKFFPENKVVLSGIPIRKEIYESATNKLELNSDLPTIYVTGGKTGSHKINFLIKDVLSSLLDYYNVVHQCGDYSALNDYEDLVKDYNLFKDQKPGKYILKKFVLSSEIGEIYSKSNLVIGRSGAHTIAEIILLKKPAIFIPIPWVSHNEQNINALFVKDLGLAEVLEEKDLSEKSLLSLIHKMFSNLGDYKVKNEGNTENLKLDTVNIISNYLLNE